MKPNYSKRLLLIVLLGFCLMFVASFFSQKPPQKNELAPQPPPQVQAIETTYNRPPSMPLLYSDIGITDWGETAKNGISSMVMLAVFLLVVSPLVKQMVESNNKLADALAALTTVIATGNSQILAKILETEKSLKEQISEMFCEQNRQILAALK